MKAHPVDGSALKPHKETLELVNPGEGALIHEPFLVHLGVKVALSTTLWAFTVSLVLRDVWSHATVPEQFAGRFCIKPAIGVKKRISV